MFSIDSLSCFAGFEESWAQILDNWGRKMLEAVHVVARMAAIGFRLPVATFTNYMLQGPHLLAPTGNAYLAPSPLRRTFPLPPFPPFVPIFRHLWLLFLLLYASSPRSRGYKQAFMVNWLVSLRPASSPFSDVGKMRGRQGNR